MHRGLYKELGEYNVCRLLEVHVVGMDEVVDVGQGDGILYAFITTRCTTASCRPVPVLSLGKKGG